MDWILVLRGHNNFFSTFEFEYLQSKIRGMTAPFAPTWLRVRQQCLMAVWFWSFCCNCKPVGNSRSPVATGGGLLGAKPPKQSSQPPQIETWDTINQWSFCQFLECQVPPHKRKAPLFKIFWRRFCDHGKINLAWLSKSATDRKMLSLLVVGSFRLHHINLSRKEIF